VPGLEEAKLAYATYGTERQGKDDVTCVKSRILQGAKPSQAVSVAESAFTCSRIVPCLPPHRTRGPFWSCVTGPPFGAIDTRKYYGGVQQIQ
jgi:hypothetical protein